MSTYSGILAWKIPRTEEPGELHSMGPQRVRYDWAHTHTHTHTHTHPLHVIPVVPQALQPAPWRTPWLWSEIIVLILTVALHLPCSLGPCGLGVKIVSHEKKGQGRAFPMLPALALEHSVIAGSKYTNNPRLSWPLVIYFKYDYLYNI